MAAVVLKDRVKETTSTTGTADFVLGGAASGYQPFSVIGPNNYTYYCCFDNATGDWEVGYGQYTTTAGGTLVRNTILSNSAATTNKISFAAGAKDVFLTYPAEKGIYEELNGNTLIDGGPLTVVGAGVTGYTTFSAALAELYGDVNSFAQMYAQNYNDGTEASADMIVYRDNTVTDTANFMDMGINSSNFSSATWPIYTPGSMYLYGDGGEMFIGSGTDDVIFFTGGVDTTDEAARFDKTTKALTTVSDVNVGGALDVTGAATFGSTVTLNADPSTNLEAATKQYVDQAVSTGLHLHQPVQVATTGNLTATYSNGTAGVGATLTNAGTQVALSIDGVSMSVNDRVLVWQQSTQAQNGIYVVTTVGSGSTNWVLTRASDADTYVPQSDTGLGGGDYFYVQEGTTGQGDSYVCTNDGAIVFGTTAITFAQFSGAITYTGGTNIDITGQVISLTGTVATTNGGTGTSTVTTGDLLYGSGTNAWGKLAAGAAYKSLVMNAGGTNVEWNAVALNQSGAVSGALPALNGGTGQSAYAVGDLLYSGTTDTLSRLAGNTTTTKKFLGQTGTGTGSAAPVWEQPAASDITGLAASATTDTTNASNISSGTLPTGRLSGSYTGITGVGTLAAGTWNGSTIGAAYGGTGQSSYAVGDLLYASTTTALSKLADVAVGNALISGGVGAAPSWGKVGLATHVSGTLPVANGGTGVTSSTGSGSVVLSASPTFTGTVSGAQASFNGGTSLPLTLTTSSAGPWSISLVRSDLGLSSNVYNGTGSQWYFQHRPSFAGAVPLDSSNYNSYALPLSGGTLSGTLNANAVYSQSQIRATGWYGTSSGTYTGLGTEVGVSGGQGYILTYNRDTSTYGTLNIASSAANMQFSGGTINVTSGALQQGGSQVVTASNIGSYAIASTGGTLTGTLTSSADSIIIGNTGGVTRGYLFNSTAGFGLLSSAGGWALQVPYGTTNVTVFGTVTANSDERLKKDWEPLPKDFVEQIATAKSGTFTRIEDGSRQAGSSAQDWQRILKEVVVVGTDEDKTLSLAYGNAALVSVIELAKRVVDQEERIARLEAIVAKLTNQGT